MKIKQADERYRETAPYLFEDEDAPGGHQITVEGADSDGDVYLRLQFARYVPQAIRDRRATRPFWSNPERAYEWAGRGEFLTRSQALKLARQLIKAAAHEADSGE